ncbi:unnamed protein product [Brassica napus]|uniref:(rape) hypothetical protein n=1 Tax=Brassica napus TaxID=3708 RepID=A0A816SMJ1_BRANA|nr:unnamed protein product [Brassica napus]
MQPQSGGKFRPKAKYGRETDSEQVPRGKRMGAGDASWSDAERSNPSADRFGRGPTRIKTPLP